MRHALSYLLVAGSVVGTIGFAAPDADACSYAPAEWVPVIRDGKLNATVQGPLVIPMEGYTNPFEELPTLADSGYTVRIADTEGVEVSGVLTTLGGDEPGFARLVFTPEEAFAEDVNYTVTVEGDAEFAGTQEVPLSIGSFSADVVTAFSAQERRRFAGTAECCDAASPDDYSCVQDSCGDYEHGEECRICWPTALTFPVSITMTNVLADAGPWRAYYEATVYDVTDGEVIVASGDAQYGQIAFELDAVPAEERCYELALDPVVDAGLEPVRSDSFCIGVDDIELADHSPLDNAEAIGRCEADSFFEVDEEGNESPIDNPTEMVDPENPDTQNNETGPDSEDTGEKAEPGGCQTTAVPASAGLWAMLLGLVAFRRRRTDRAGR